MSFKSHPECMLSWQRRLSLSTLHPQVVQTLEDHHQEVLSLYRDFGFAGLIAQDSEFALCNVPAYFSSHALKLSWNGKNLTTHQYLLSEAARQLGLKTQHLPCFAALLGEEQHARIHRPTPTNTHNQTCIRHISLTLYLSECCTSLSAVPGLWDDGLLKEFLTCRKSYSAWWGPGCLPLESAGTRTPTCFSQGTFFFTSKVLTQTVT